MIHSMQLHPAPFEMIKDGKKTIELRLYDEKRRKIRVGDTILFTNTATGEMLDVNVLNLSVFDSFEKLYKELPLLECGYTEDDIDTASPNDMAVYYSEEKQKEYGVVGIKVELLTKVRFYEAVEDGLLKFAVIIAKTNGRWVFCKHKRRSTYEIPGGHREDGESIEATARRELCEETGAIDYTLKPVCVYSVTAPDNFDGEETFGMLYYADILSFEPELHSEIERVVIMDDLPAQWSYPLIHPKLIAEARRRRCL